MTNSLRIKVYLSPGARTDLEGLNERALKHPHGKEEALLEAAIVMLHRLNGRRHPTKPLDYNPHFADLSDCDTTYVGADPYEKPPLRIVSRDIRPSRPDGITRREIVAIGARQDSKVYRITGERLGRPVGVTLAELAAQREPAMDPLRSRQRSVDGFDAPPADEPDLLIR
ncbi:MULTISPECIES: hypothetical protein [Streptomyces]|uniref:hypothetical protein n=1 Tax=Streptomyces TaxID=1883 RepID=UPI0004CDCBB7|nr:MULTISPECIES: hypothetical protein [Streptomyces]KOT57094.1 hypothetical protein ADK43_21960 [Streptomyces rimosus subsp. rimosus]